MVVGCAGIEPYEPRDNREEGPEKGLFTGSGGEFVIYRKAEASETGSEVGRRSDEAADDELPKIDSEEKKAKMKGGERQP